VIRLLPFAAALLLAACGSQPKPAANEFQQLPAAGQVSSQQVSGHILGKPFLPGGTLAHYKTATAEYDMFVAPFPSHTDASIALANLEGTIQGAKLVKGMDGYFGSDAGRPIFVFPMDRWIGGVLGLSQAEAEQAARRLAANFK
jgi:hypothetical protein